MPGPPSRAHSSPATTASRAHAGPPSRANLGGDGAAPWLRPADARTLGRPGDATISAASNEGFDAANVEEGRNPAAPPYVTVTDLRRTLRGLTARVAWPPESAADRRVLPRAESVTEPVGTSPPGETGSTSAVKLSETIFLPLCTTCGARTIRVSAGTTDPETPSDAPPAPSALLPWTAVIAGADGGTTGGVGAGVVGVGVGAGVVEVGAGVEGGDVGVEGGDVGEVGVGVGAGVVVVGVGAGVVVVGEGVVGVGVGVEGVGVGVGGGTTGGVGGETTIVVVAVTTL